MHLLCPTKYSMTVFDLTGNSKNYYPSTLITRDWGSTFDVFQKQCYLKRFHFCSLKFAKQILKFQFHFCRILHLKPFFHGKWICLDLTVRSTNSILLSCCKERLFTCRERTATSWSFSRGNRGRAACFCSSRTGYNFIIEYCKSFSLSASSVRHLSFFYIDCRLIVWLGVALETGNPKITSSSYEELQNSKWTNQIKRL